jgi:hypothetical protein
MGHQPHQASILSQGLGRMASLHFFLDTHIAL